MNHLQPGVIAGVPPVARYLTFSLRPRTNPRRSLAALAALADGKGCVVGVGDSVWCPPVRRGGLDLRRIT